MVNNTILLQPATAICRVSPLPASCCFRAGPRRWNLAVTPVRLGASSSMSCSSSASLGSSRCRQQLVVRAAADDKDRQGDEPVKYNKEFGYSRKDVILIGVGIIGVGYALYYGLQAAGLEPGMAGNFVQLFVILGISLGWVGSYLFRVATKQMTYVKQLEDYEEAVMAKRLQEMPEAEMERLLEEVEEEKSRKAARRGSSQKE